MRKLTSTLLAIAVFTTMLFGAEFLYYGRAYASGATQQHAAVSIGNGAVDITGAVNIP
jgi:hypothetical protein